MQKTDKNLPNSPKAPNMTRHCCQALLSEAPVGVVAAGADLKILYINPAAEKIIQAPQQSFGTILDLVDPSQRDSIRTRLTQSVEVTSKLMVNISPEVTTDRSDLLVSFTRIDDDEGSTCGVVAWIIDPKSHGAISDRLAQSEKMASLGTLAAGVAHHFNNILGGVATFVDFALTSGDPASMKRALQVTAEASARAAIITESLLSFTKSDSLKPDMADLTEIVLTFSHLIEGPLKRKNIKLHLDLQPVPIRSVEANCMHQVLGILLTNAEEAMPDGGEITISLTSHNSDVELTFTDSGSGIEPQDLPLIFEPFFTTKGLLAGGEKTNPGLGLSIAHGKILEMGGSIQARSNKPTGSQIQITLPQGNQ